MSLQNKIVALDNEVKALKASFQASLGQLRYSDQTPSDSYTGSIDTQSQSLIIAKLEATFTRTDGKTSTPLVDFGFQASVTPDHKTVIESQGGTLTGNDLTAYEDIYINGAVTATTATSVTFTINVLNAVAPWGSTPKTLAVVVEAYSTVKGTLTIRRTV